ncbi:membrane protein [Streptomyces phage Bmoc]|uniref:Membrane protein n=1 Tax=Streptomyces phage Bmoc TaxID=2725629 RepID=A0A6M3T0V5_9CAUD|nr:membrane protein [Streptomyces phage Bmoc]QJD50912.1 membrane protein [Streptomyces phage Bmoc]
MSDTARTADEAVSNVKLIGMAVWTWLSAHPAVLAVLFFLLGFLIG